uniref:Lipoprotein n=1 Tax=Strongyloides stercoralis TaxID=6248 RepID=A0A0K0EQQ5_STRER
MSYSGTFVPFEGEELENSQYVFENLPPVESVYADVLLSDERISHNDVQKEILNSSFRVFDKNTLLSTNNDNTKIQISKAYTINLSSYKNVKQEKIYHLSAPWKGWSGTAKIVPKSKTYTITFLKFKKKTEKKKISLDDKLNFVSYQPRQVAYFY